MKTLPRILILLSLFSSGLIACRAPTASSASTSAARPTILWPTVTSSPTITLTATPQPSPTPTNTPLVPPTLTPTTLPLSFQLAIFEQIWDVVNETYVDPDFNGVDWNGIRDEFRQMIEAGLDNLGFYTAMYEMIARLGDDHSVYLTPEDVAEEEATYSGNHDYVGIGVLHSSVPERNRSVILAVFPGSPAETAGLQPRDAIISVDGIPIIDEQGYLQEIVRGPEGSSMELTVQTPGQGVRQVTVTRQRITGAVSIPYSVFTTPSGLQIGYIFLFAFDDSTIDEQVAEALRQMSAERQLDGLILDLRNNGGGANTVVVPILGYFVEGVMGYYVYRQDERPLTISANDINGSLEVPLVLLVGSGTASFGEIFAGVLQDSGRAQVIGTTTDGNVEVLWGYRFDDGSKLWLASETFRPSNQPDQDWEATGIIPDEIVAGEFDENTLENDPPVIAAITYIESLP